MIKLIYQTAKLALWIPVLMTYFVLMWAAWAVGRAWHACGRLMEPDVRWVTLMSLCYAVMPWAFVPAACGAWTIIGLKFLGLAPISAPGDV